MIKDALEAVQKRMADAMAKAGRTDRVTLIAVTKKSSRISGGNGGAIGRPHSGRKSSTGG